MGTSDDNTLQDVEGVILCLQSDMATEAPEFPVAPRFRELAARIEDRLNRNKNPVRRNWLETARSHALDAQRAFLEHRLRDSCDSLDRCREYLEQGNKAHRRKAAFFASTDGMVIPAETGEDGEPTHPPEPPIGRE